MFNVIKNGNFLIAEIAQAHDGSISFAKSFVDQAKKSGADAVKFQIHFAEEESSYQDKFRKKFSNDKTRFDYWKRIEFTELEWIELYKYCKKKKIIASPFSNRAFLLLKKINLNIWKIASGEFFNSELIDKIIDLKKLFLISTGMSTLNEIQKMVKYLKKRNAKFVLMHCVSNYPTSLERCSLGKIEYFQKKLKCITGFSDHSGKILPSIIALNNGAKVIEVHVKFRKNSFGPDASSSLTFKEFKDLRAFSNQLKIINLTKNDNYLDKEQKRNLKLFTKSICINQNIKKGTILKKTHFNFRKPGTGLNPNKLKDVLNKISSKDLKKNYLLTLKDFN